MLLRGFVFRLREEEALQRMPDFNAGTWSSEWERKKSVRYRICRPRLGRESRVSKFLSWYSGAPVTRKN
jgi:hypothetical protein